MVIRTWDANDARTVPQTQRQHAIGRDRGKENHFTSNDIAVQLSDGQSWHQPNAQLLHEHNERVPSAHTHLSQ